jgi:hypothetical protein
MINRCFLVFLGIKFACEGNENIHFYFRPRWPLVMLFFLYRNTYYNYSCTHKRVLNLGLHTNTSLITSLLADRPNSYGLVMLLISLFENRGNERVNPLHDSIITSLRFSTSLSRYIWKVTSVYLLQNQP